jgi:hypothetical protein
VLPRDEAAQLIDHIQRNLDETNRILSTQASSLDEVIRARLGSHAQFGGPLMEQAQVMREMIMRLYEDAGYTASLEPAL